MPFCRNCGNELDEEAQFCPKCGTPVKNQVMEKQVRARQRSMSPWLIAGIVIVAVIVLIGIIFVAFLFGGFLPFGRVGSGNIITREEPINDFSAVEVGSGFNVQVLQASSYRVLITADDNLIDDIQVSKSGNTLQISLRPFVSFTASSLKAVIYMPNVDRIQFSGGTIGSASGFQLSHELRVELSGGSRLDMIGEANKLIASCSGGSRLNFGDFKVNDAEVNLSGGSQGTIRLDGNLNADLSGGSHLNYIGNPTLNVNNSGGSSISKTSN